MTTHSGSIHQHLLRALSRALVIIITLCWLFGGSAQGRVFTVTNEFNAGAGSLRQAVNDANDGDEIKFANNVNKIVLSNILPLIINTSLTITGPGPTQLSIGHSFNAIIIASIGNNNVTISGLTIAYGIVGILSNSNSLTLSNVLVTENDTGIVNVGRLVLDNTVVSFNDSSGKGGGISNNGELTLVNNSIVKDNSALQAGGIFCGLQGSISLTNSSVLDNTALGVNGAGGGIYMTGIEMTLSGAIVKGNIADYGAGIFFRGNNIISRNVTNTTITSNVARLGGGGLYQKTSNVALSGSTVSFNKVLNGPGGGVFLEKGTLKIDKSTFDGNNATIDGAGIRNVAGTVTIDTSSIIGNGPVIRFVGAFKGGGISNSGTMTITKSSITDNSGRLKGGGLFNDGSLALMNSTISGNNAISGGGLTNTTNPSGIGGSTTLNFTTITDNTNGGIENTGGKVSLRKTIIAKQRGGKDCVGAVQSVVYNLDSDNTCVLTAVTDLPAVDPKLGSLQKNGGPTVTHALLKGSPAIDSIPERSCTLPLDQRGIKRPQGDQKQCDRGAFEFKDEPILKVVDGFFTPMLDGDFTPSSDATVEPSFIGLDGSIIRTGTFSLNDGEEKAFDTSISATNLSAGKQVINVSINPTGTFTWNILSPTEAIEHVIVSIDEQLLNPELDQKTHRRLEKTLDILYEAFDDLTIKNIPSALRAMRKAAKNLMNTERRGVVIPVGLRFLVDTARQIALDEIELAEQDTGTSKKVDKPIDKALQAMDKAQEAWNKGKADKAIDHALKAWKKAQKVNML